MAPPARRAGSRARRLRFATTDPRLLVVFVVFTMVGTFAFNYSVSLLKISHVRYADIGNGEAMFGAPLAVTGFGSTAGAPAVHRCRPG